MDSLHRLSLCVLFVCPLLCASGVWINITAGQTITLSCRAPDSNKPITVVEWSRADLGDKEHVLLYRDDQFDPENQHPSFANRVDLQDRQMKDGDVSLILKNVTPADNGTYECRFVQRGTNRRKRANLDDDPICIVQLSVVPPGQAGGHTEDQGKEDGVSRGHVGLLAGLSAFGVIMAVMAARVIFKTQKKKDPSDPPSPPDKEADQQLV